MINVESLFVGLKIGYSSSWWRSPRPPRLSSPFHPPIPIIPNISLAKSGHEPDCFRRLLYKKKTSLLKKKMFFFPAMLLCFASVLSFWLYRISDSFSCKRNSLSILARPRHSVRRRRPLRRRHLSCVVTRARPSVSLPFYSCFRLWVHRIGDLTAINMMYTVNKNWCFFDQNIRVFVCLSREFDLRSSDECQRIYGVSEAR